MKYVQLYRNAKRSLKSLVNGVFGIIAETALVVCLTMLALAMFFFWWSLVK